MFQRWICESCKKEFETESLEVVPYCIKCSRDTIPFIDIREDEYIC